MKSISLKKYCLLPSLAIALIATVCDARQSPDSSVVVPVKTSTVANAAFAAEISQDDVSGGYESGTFNTKRGCAKAFYTPRIELSIQGVEHWGCGDSEDSDAPDRFNLRVTGLDCTDQSCAVSYDAPKGCVSGSSGQNFGGIHFSYILYCIPKNQ